jgi:UrcA family protein
MNNVKDERAPLDEVRVSKPKITLAMLMCGIVSAAGIGAVSAATPDEDVRSVAVRYDAQAVSTEQGAKTLYRRLVSAADAVCPADPVSSHFISRAVRECREQSIARAVFKINTPSLVAVYNTSSKHG